MAIVLRTLWAQRAIAALESWLQTVFGLSIRRGAGSAENSMDEDDETDDAEVAMAGLVRAMSSSSNSSSTSVGTSGSTGSEDSTASFYSRRKKKGGLFSGGGFCFTIWYVSNLSVSGSRHGGHL